MKTGDAQQHASTNANGLVFLQIRGPFKPRQPSWQYDQATVDLYLKYNFKHVVLKRDESKQKIFVSKIHTFPGLYFASILSVTGKPLFFLSKYSYKVEN
jgi:hypothetical protein